MASFDTREIAAGQYLCCLRTAGHTFSVPLEVLR
jgi:hypothetical protein